MWIFEGENFFIKVRAFFYMFILIEEGVDYLNGEFIFLESDSDVCKVRRF